MNNAVYKLHIPANITEMIHITDKDILKWIS